MWSFENELPATPQVAWNFESSLDFENVKIRYSKIFKELIATNINMLTKTKTKELDANN